MHSVLVKLLLVMLVSLLGARVWAQEITDSLNRSNWKIGVVNGFGTSTLKAKNGKWEGEWHIPEVSFSYELAFSRKLTPHFWLGTGISVDYFRFRSKAFVHSGTTGYLTQTGNGLVYYSYQFTDPFERYSERVNAYLSIPVFVEYSSEKKIGLYAKTGVRFSFAMMNSFENNFAENNHSINTYYPVEEIGNETIRTLFAQTSVGLQMRFGNTIGTLGLSCTNGIIDLAKTAVSERNYPNALRFEIGLHGFPLQKNFTELSNPLNEMTRKRREYVYLELLGNELFYSVNFEHSLISLKKIRWNVRLGGAIHPRGAITEKLALTGTSLVFGRRHAAEVGYCLHFYGDGKGNKDFRIAPTIGYRFEPRGMFFGRVNYTPVYYTPFDFSDNLLSAGQQYGAVSIGMHF